MFYEYIEKIGISKDVYKKLNTELQISIYKDYRLSKILEELNDIQGVKNEL